MCSRLQSDLEANFARKIINFEQVSFWDSPSAYRLLHGLMRRFNDMSRNGFALSSYLHLDHKQEHLGMALNCRAETIHAFASEVLPANTTELRVGGNILETFLPYDNLIDVQFTFDWF